MPTNPTYPGVYIEEVPSGARAIIGVATSRTAFIGRARKGPVNEPVNIKNFGDFERRFGGLWADSTMSYAVRQYFQNGGTDAIIVRIVNPDAQGAGSARVLGAAPATAVLASALQPFTIRAKDGLGAKGNDILVTITDATDVRGTNDPDLFNLYVWGVRADGRAKNEEYVDVSLAEDSASTATPKPSRLATAVAGSELVELADTAPIAGAHLLRVTERRLAGVRFPHMIKGPDAAGTNVDILEVEARAGIITGDRRVKVRVLDAASGTATQFNLEVWLEDTAGTMIGSKESYANLANAEAARTALNGGSTLLLAPADGVKNNALRPRNHTGTIVLSDDSPAFTVLNTSKPAAGAATLTLTATDAGRWGNRLRVSVDHETKRGLSDEFNLTVEEVDASGTVVLFEVHHNLMPSEREKRGIKKVLEQESLLVRVAPGSTVPATRPAHIDSLAFRGGEDGPPLHALHYIGSPSRKEGLFALEKEDLFNILCVPPPAFDADTDLAVWEEALAYCKKRRAFLIIDPLSAWNEREDVMSAMAGDYAGLRDPNAAIYFPRVRMPDPLQENRLVPFVPSGAVAGIYARTDAARGVWKAPAGQEANIIGARELTVKLTDPEHGDLNPLGVNCLRSFPTAGRVVWGARTMRGADQLASEWKYIPVRRLALFIEETLFRNTQWVVFEPNDEPLWAQIRLSVGAFMHGLFRQGAFQGGAAKDAYFVKCDKETTPQDDIDRGIVNILVGFAPLKPAEFVIVKISQIAKKAGA